MSNVQAWDSWLLEWVWRSSWDAALLTGIVFCAQQLLGKRLAPTWRHGMWMVVIARLVWPVFPESHLSVFNLVRPPLALPVADGASALPPGLPRGSAASPSYFGSTADVGRGGSAATSRTPQANVTPWKGSLARITDWTNPVGTSGRTLARIWFGVAALLALRLVLKNAAFSFRLRRAAAPPSTELSELVDRCRREMGLQRPVRLWLTPAVDHPALYGLFRPVILLPAGIASWVDPVELRLVLLHELAHLKRRDMALHWVIAALEVLHWFNPVLIFAFARMRADRELACDALALAHTQGNAWWRYGETLIKFATRFPKRRALAGSIGILGQPGLLKRRIAAIAGRGRPTHARWVMVTVTGALSLTTLTDARTPGGVGSGPTKTSSAGPVAVESPANGRHLHLRVLDERSGKPLPGSWLRVSYKSASTISPEPALHVCDSAGVARVPIPTLAHHFQVTIEASHAGKATRSVTWSPFHHDSWDDIPERYELKLGDSMTIRGRVVDAHDAPVAGARISMHWPGSWTRAMRERLLPGGEDHCELTDASGNWHCEHMPSTVTGWTFLITHPQLAQAVFVQASALMEDPPAAGVILERSLKQGSATIRLPHPASIVSPNPNAFAGLPVQSATGKAVSAPAHVRALHSDLDYSMAWALLSMPPVRVQGRVLDFATGQPIRGFAVRLVERVGTSEPDVAAVWDRGVTAYGTNGNFHVLLLQPNLDYALEVSAEGYATFTSAWAEPDGDRTRTFRLRKRELAGAYNGRWTRDSTRLASMTSAQSTPPKSRPKGYP